MRRTLIILSLLFVSTLFAACGERPTTISNANAQSNATGATTTGMSNQGTGATEGTGPQNQGIGGNTNEGVVNGNTYTVPPGFNKNGDTGSATRNGNTR
jgi:hypothetical protein